MRFDNREDIIQLTPKWEGERFDNGRPRVPDHVIKRLQKVALEEAWGVCWGNDYKYQFQGDWKVINGTPSLVGRAVTGVMVPRRPDLHDTLLEYGHKEEGRVGFFNSWVIETLVPDDVLVIDMFDKIFQGTYSGGNLSNAIRSRGGRGQVLWCGIRDVQQVMDVEGLATYYRGNDPTGIGDVTLVGLNTPCRIGNAICMPGDVVLGDAAGIIFIPPHLAEECCERAERIQLREIFQFQRIKEGVYNSHEMDSKWTEAIEADFRGWRRTSTPAGYEHLEWEEDKKDDQKASEGAGTLI
ncbi:MAG: RraA family protein [Gemmatimonadota bacterium]